MTTPTMTSRGRAVGASALMQARTDLRIALFSPLGLTYLIAPVIAVAVMYFMRNSELMGTQISAAQHFLPGMLAAGLVMGGTMGVASELMQERDDGTLLRMKAIPDGMRGYLLAKTLTQLALNLVATTLILVPAVVMFPSAAPADPVGWLGILGMFILGIFATVPLGAVLGAALRNPILIGVVGMASYGLVAISGVVWPLTALPGWLQIVGQLSPMYWLGVGFRHAMLPAHAVALEVGGSWRTIEMLGVLGLWIALGMVLAPLALRRMIRGASGSDVAKARERILSRGY